MSKTMRKCNKYRYCYVIQVNSNGVWQDCTHHSDRKFMYSVYNGLKYKSVYTDIRIVQRRILNDSL